MKKQISPLTKSTGSFINHIYANNATEPKVNEFATIMHYTDRSVVKVKAIEGNTVTLENYTTKADLNLPCPVGHQNWVHEPTGHCFIIEWRKNAWKRKSVEVVFTKEFSDSIPSPCIGLWLRKNNPELFEQLYNNEIRPINIIEGITKKVNTYIPIKIIFGVCDYYYDWTF